jgi:hypothetical protein
MSADVREAGEAGEADEAGRRGLRARCVPRRAHRFGCRRECGIVNVFATDVNVNTTDATAGATALC